MLEHIGLRPHNKLSEETTAGIASAVKQATDEGYDLANSLEMISHDRDPFATFAHRARNAQFRKRIKNGHE